MTIKLTHQNIFVNKLTNKNKNSNAHKSMLAIDFR